MNISVRGGTTRVQVYICEHLMYVCMYNPYVPLVGIQLDDLHCMVTSYQSPLVYVCTYENGWSVSSNSTPPTCRFSLAPDVNPLFFPRGPSVISIPDCRKIADLPDPRSLVHMFAFCTDHPVPYRPANPVRSWPSGNLAIWSLGTWALCAAMK